MSETTPDQVEMSVEVTDIVGEGEEAEKTQKLNVKPDYFVMSRDEFSKFTIMFPKNLIVKSLFHVLNGVETERNSKDELVQKLNKTNIVEEVEDEGEIVYFLVNRLVSFLDKHKDFMKYIMEHINLFDEQDGIVLKLDSFFKQFGCLAHKLLDFNEYMHLVCFPALNMSILDHVVGMDSVLKSILIDIFENSKEKLTCAQQWKRNESLHEILMMKIINVTFILVANYWMYVNSDEEKNYYSMTSIDVNDLNLLLNKLNTEKDRIEFFIDEKSKAEENFHLAIVEKIKKLFCPKSALAINTKFLLEKSSEFKRTLVLMHDLLSTNSQDNSIDNFDATGLFDQFNSLKASAAKMLELMEFLFTRECHLINQVFNPDKEIIKKSPELIPEPSHEPSEDYLHFYKAPNESSPNGEEIWEDENPRVVEDKREIQDEVFTLDLVSDGKDNEEVKENDEEENARFGKYDEKNILGSSIKQVMEQLKKRLEPIRNETQVREQMAEARQLGILGASVSMERSLPPPTERSSLIRPINPTTSASIPKFAIEQIPIDTGLLGSIKNAIQMRKGCEEVHFGDIEDDET